MATDIDFQSQPNKNQNHSNHKHHKEFVILEEGAPRVAAMSFSSRDRGATTYGFPGGVMLVILIVILAIFL